MLYMTVDLDCAGHSPAGLRDLQGVASSQSDERLRIWSMHFSLPVLFLHSIKILNSWCLIGKCIRSEINVDR